MKIKFFFALIILILLLLVFYKNKTFYSYTCTNCHSEKRFLNFQKRSFHSNLTCVDCHLKEGFFYFASLFIPTVFKKSKIYERHHKLDVNNCLKCHTNNMPDVINKKYIFTHKKHLYMDFFGSKLLCQNCHTDIAHKTYIKSSKYICFLCHKIKTPSNPQDCYFCHTNTKNKPKHPVKNCDYCHTIEDSDISVDIERCLNCHNLLKTNFESNKVLHEIHKKTTIVYCLDCHDRTIHRK